MLLVLDLGWGDGGFRLVLGLDGFEGVGAILWSVRFFLFCFLSLELWVMGLALDYEHTPLDLTAFSMRNE